MAKVKKRGAVTSVRSVRASKKPAKTRTTSKTKANARSKAQSISRSSQNARRTPPAPLVRVVVKSLAPQEKCGPDTSVQLLYRVDETVGGRSTTHLVFFDRHGWYCEHGRHCPAVGHAKKHKRHIARAS